MALSKNISDFLKDAFKTYQDTLLVSKGDKLKSLELIVEEQRRDYDYLLHIYNPYFPRGLCHVGSSREGSMRGTVGSSHMPLY